MIHKKINALELLYHLACCSFYSYVLCYGIPMVRGHMDTFLGQHKFLTIQCLYFQVFYYVCATLIDIKGLFVYGSEKSDSYGYRFHRDYLFSGLVFPITTTVSVMFWSVYFTDREKVCPPEELDCFLDYTFSNHALHTAPILTSLLESFGVYHTAPWTFLQGIQGWMVYVSGFIAMVYWIAHVKHFWVYTLLSKMSPLHRAVFLFGGFGFFGAFAYMVGVYLIRKRWSMTVNEKQKRLWSKMSFTGRVWLQNIQTLIK